jgi:hypothetical protein
MGRPWERVCDTSEEADDRRLAVIKKLRCHLKPPRNLFDAGMIVSLRHCTAEDPCLSGNCPVCERALQRWFVSTGFHIGRRMARAGRRPRILSIVPDFGRVARGELHCLNFQGFRQKTTRAFEQAGLPWFRGALDVSFNHEAGDRESGFFQLQWWGIVSEFDKGIHDRLVLTLNESGEVRRPVYRRKAKWPKSALGYSVKDEFTRRETFWDTSVCDRGREACFNTRDRKLLGLEWVEVNRFLRKIGLSNRILIVGSEISDEK